MNTVANMLKAKCNELDAEVKKQVDFVNQTNNALAKLRAERKLALAKIQEYNGGIIAYSSTLKVMETEQGPLVAAHSAVVEGEVVPETGAAVLD